ncbi:MAG: hypothetical protein A2431_02725 [Candidatus Zambryskibacteria bacterium RIFOXYC1_FULL_39_10]|uniref:Uncharacterized protein n=1 Tax=Candidatus Zambryskibacteria bacterium RIFOXYC1_FULL_39_10 TaxID=1802779 RepID=A0A1G2UXZ5_9BACT|nr:MAG: hypothetical protein A2431_02725 [Candidatus Zambryskibacteria bacterium RIFOXYC1_FULL_39_10]OHB14794.1 MAG: hypothetical protein A2605_04025 [Candidatus Zambryskibacteria bacterium RIFOXYD1_FULL_39_35]
MNYGGILIIVGLFLIIIVIVNMTVSKRMVKNDNTEKPIINNKENMEENKQKLDFGVWSGFKFGFGFGLGIIILGFLISVILTLMGFTLSKIIFGGLPMFK